MRRTPYTEFGVGNLYDSIPLPLPNPTPGSSHLATFTCNIPTHPHTQKHTQKSGRSVFVGGPKMTQ